ncbi:MAG: GNAT family N-acetyltransferase [Chloroflexi bacterium]|nr:GNAT family N-acetyltransferase [Chloroflexota bacterium]
MLSLSSLTVRPETFASLSSRWDHLWPGPAAHPIFGQPAWHEVWWRHFSDGYQLLLLAVRRDQALLGVAPLKQRDGTISFIAGPEVTDFLDVVVAPAAEPSVLDALTAFLAEQDAHTLDLQSLRPDSATLAGLPDRLRRAGWTVSIADEDTSPAADLPATWDGHLASLSQKDRHELRRKLRRLNEQADVRMVSLTDRGAIEANLDDFFRLHRLSRPDKAEFMTPQMEAFFRDLLGTLADRGKVRLGYLEIGGVRAAAAVSFETEREVLLYNSGYDPAFAHLSIGLLLKALGVKGAIERGKSRYDFLRGNERYKYDLGARDVPLRRLIAHRSGSP